MVDDIELNLRDPLSSMLINDHLEVTYFRLMFSTRTGLECLLTVYL